MITFTLIAIAVGFAVWYRVNKNERALQNLCEHHLVPEKKDDTTNKDHVKVAQKQPVKEPTTAASAPMPAPEPVVSPPAVPNSTSLESPQIPHHHTSERWQDWLALSTIIIAIMAAVMTLEVSRYTTMAVLSNGKESNAWSVYQSKSVKEHTYVISKAALELQLSGIPGISPEAAEKYKKTIKTYDDEIKRYKDEKDEISEQAKALGKKKDTDYKLAEGLSNALGFLQISIVLSAIATMMRKKYIWYVSLSMLGGWGYFIANCF